MRRRSEKEREREQTIIRIFVVPGLNFECVSVKNGKSPQKRLLHQAHSQEFSDRAKKHKAAGVGFRFLGLVELFRGGVVWLCACILRLSQGTVTSLSTMS